MNAVCGTAQSLGSLATIHSYIHTYTQTDRRKYGVLKALWAIKVLKMCKLFAVLGSVFFTITQYIAYMKNTTVGRGAGIEEPCPSYFHTFIHTSHSIAESRLVLFLALTNTIYYSVHIFGVCFGHVFLYVEMAISHLRPSDYYMH